MYKALLLLLSLSCTAILPAQSWQWAQQAVSPRPVSGGCMDADPQGHLYVAGQFTDSVTLGSTTLRSPARFTLYLAKYDPQGNLLWARVCGSTEAFTGFTLAGVQVSAQGHVGITGSFSDSAFFGEQQPVKLVSAGSNDVFIASFGAGDGACEWARAEGGAGIDYAGGISSDDAGSFYITGDLHKTSFSGSPSIIFISRYHPSGQLAWSRQSQRYGTGHYGMGISTRPGGTSVITGSFFNVLQFDSSDSLDAGSPESTAFLVCFDAQGAFRWERQAGGGGGYTSGTAVSHDAAGQVYAAGFFRGTIAFDQLSLTGMAGMAYEGFTAQYDSLGHIAWVSRLNGSSNISAISAGPGGCYIAGVFSSTLSVGQQTLTNTGHSDLFIALVSAQGQPLWAVQGRGGEHADLHPAAIRSRAGALFAAGTYTDSIALGSAIVYTAPGRQSTFAARLSLPVTGIAPGDPAPGPGVQLFPNPAAERLQWSSTFAAAHYSISTLQGRIMAEGPAHGQDEVAVSALPAGMYIIRLYAADGSAVQLRFIKAGGS